MERRDRRRPPSVLFVTGRKVDGYKTWLITGVGGGGGRGGGRKTERESSTLMTSSDDPKLNLRTSGGLVRLFVF